MSIEYEFVYCRLSASWTRRRYVISLIVHNECIVLTAEIRLPPGVYSHSCSTRAHDRRQRDQHFHHRLLKKYTRAMSRNRRPNADIHYSTLDPEFHILQLHTLVQIIQYRLHHFAICLIQMSDSIILQYPNFLTLPRWFSGIIRPSGFLTQEFTSLSMGEVPRSIRGWGLF